jgi:hypothetical protein
MDLPAAASKFLFSKEPRYQKPNTDLDTLFPKSEGSSGIHRGLMALTARILADKSLTVPQAEIQEEEAQESISNLVKEHGKQKRKAEAQKKGSSAGKKAKKAGNEN